MELCCSDKIVGTQEWVYFVNTNEGGKKKKVFFKHIHMVYLIKTIIHTVTFKKTLILLKSDNTWLFQKKETLNYRERKQVTGKEKTL